MNTDITTEQITRLITAGRKIWKALTEDEKCNYYYDNGTYAFVAKVADLLYIDLNDLYWTEFDDIHNKIIYGKGGRNR